LDEKYQKKLKQLGKHIRSLREKAGLSQEELGFKADIHRTYVSEIELGIKNPTYITLLKIAEALSLHIYDVIPKE
jgi:transcriptional regulator with XRE-family HTH domain